MKGRGVNGCGCKEADNVFEVAFCFFYCVLMCPEQGTTHPRSDYGPPGGVASTGLSRWMCLSPASSHINDASKHILLANLCLCLSLCLLLGLLNGVLDFLFLVVGLFS